MITTSLRNFSAVSKSLKKAPQKRYFMLLAVLAVMIGVQPTLESRAASTNQPAYAEKLEIYIHNHMDSYNIPGLAIAIVRDGEVEYLNGFGVTNPGGDPVTADTPFLLASVTKSFTALGVMQLVEAGRIDLDDPVKKHIPWFDVAGGEGDEITVAQLLYHASGLPELEGNEFSFKPDTPDALAAGVRDLAEVSLHSSPGSAWEYSNLNYNALGLLIQEISSSSYQAYIEDNIFAPLDMSHSFTSMSAAREAGAANGFYPFFGIPVVFDENLPKSLTSLPTGGLWSSASDMSRYLIAHLNGGRLGEAVVLSPEGMGILHEPGFDLGSGFSYAGGWFLIDSFMDAESLANIETELKENHDELTVIYHDGDLPSFKSMVLMIPEVNFGVVLLMNTNNAPIRSVFSFAGWDVALVATGGEAQYFPPGEPFVVHHSKLVFCAVALLVLGGFVWSLRMLKSPSGQAAFGRENIRSLFLRAGIPILVCAALLGYLYLKLLPEQAANLFIMQRLSPDLWILTVLVTLLSIGWAVISTVMIFRSLNNPKKAVSK